MGRYYQRRRSGTSDPVPSGPGPPPAPVLALVVVDLTVAPTGGDDTGGKLRIYDGPSSEGPWSLRDQQDWSVLATFEDPGSGFYVARELGNGVSYAGESGNSNVVEIE